MYLLKSTTFSSQSGRNSGGTVGTWVARSPKGCMQCLFRDMWQYLWVTGHVMLPHCMLWWPPNANTASRADLYSKTSSNESVQAISLDQPNTRHHNQVPGVLGLTGTEGSQQAQHTWQLCFHYISPFKLPSTNRIKLHAKEHSKKHYL